MIAPPYWIIGYALELAAQSPCRSKRGVVVYAPSTAHLGVRTLGTGHNGPPRGFACPGREACTGTCGQRCVHAEMRALRAISYPVAEVGRIDLEAEMRWRAGLPARASQLLDLVHVELAPDGGVVACDGPRCWQCSREIADVGAIGRVWLYEATASGPAWRSYSADEFHRATLIACGMVP